MKCLLCHSQTKVTEKINHNQLSSLYEKSFGIKTQHLLDTDLHYHHCPSCDFRFFALEDGRIPTGDNDFYNHLNKLPWYYFSEKYEYTYVKDFIKPNDKVLEVGCGKAAFAKYIPKAQYIGLELSTDAKKMAQESGILIENQMIEEYAKNHQDSQNVVCSFQVLEHTSDPRSFLQAQINTLGGGGTLIIAVPSEDSFITHTTNGILNMPPHHIGRFSDLCLQNIASLFDLELIQIHHEPLQKEHFDFYKAVMFSKRFFKPKLLSNNPLRKITNRLGRYFEKIPTPCAGHTVIAIYRKR